jgi:hypothetical protein
MTHPRKHSSAGRWLFTVHVLASLLMSMAAIPATAAPPHDWVEVIV